jgi:hypothetical protein
MSKRLLTTFVIMSGITGSALAEVFPNDGYMQANTAYDNAATYAVMGVFDGTAYALAEYEDVLAITAGKYLPRGSYETQTCTAGNFCPGIDDATFSETLDQGLYSCADLDDGAYPYSVAGTIANTGCFRECSATDVAHATAVSGNDYYGDEVVSCTVTDCAEGYHVNAGTECAANMIAITWNGTTDENVSLTNSGYCFYGSDVHAPVAASSVSGKHFLGWRIAGDEHADMDLLTPNQVIANGCTFANLGVHSGSIEMIAVYEDEIGPEPTTISCSAGYYLHANDNACSICPENSYCPGGTNYAINSSNNQGVYACANGLVSTEGSKTANDCGIVMHFDEDVLYLTKSKQTTPALAVRVDGVTYYAKTTTASKPMNSNTTHRLKVRVEGVEYSVHDNTIE